MSLENSHRSYNSTSVTTRKQNVRYRPNGRNTGCCGSFRMTRTPSSNHDQFKKRRSFASQSEGFSQKSKVVNRRVFNDVSSRFASNRPMGALIRRNSKSCSSSLSIVSTLSVNGDSNKLPIRRMGNAGTKKCDVPCSISISNDASSSNLVESTFQSHQSSLASLSASKKSKTDKSIENKYGGSKAEDRPNKTVSINTINAPRLHSGDNINDMQNLASCDLEENSIPFSIEFTSPKVKDDYEANKFIHKPEGPKQSSQSSVFVATLETDELEDYSISIPSISSSSTKKDDQDCDQSGINETVGPKYRADIVSNSSDDSQVSKDILSWGLLVALLGSPASKAITSNDVKNQKPQNPWRDEEGCSDAILSQEIVCSEEQTRHAPRKEVNAMIAFEEKKSSDSLWYEEDKFESQYNDGCRDDSDSHSIPSIYSHEESNPKEHPKNPKLDDNTAPIHLISRSSNKYNNRKVSNQILSWGILAAFMGSPAPKAISMKHDRKPKSRNLWANDSEDDDCLDKIFLPQENAYPDDGINPLTDKTGCAISTVFGEEVKTNSCFEGDATDGCHDDKCDESSDRFSIPSISLSLENKTVEDLDQSGLHDTFSSNHNFDPILSVKDDKKMANGILSWGVLAALLQSTSPKSMSMENDKKQKAANLWADDCYSDTCDDMISLTQDYSES